MRKVRRPQHIQRRLSHAAAITGCDGGCEPANLSRQETAHLARDRHPDRRDLNAIQRILWRSDGEDRNACVPDRAQALKPGMAPEIEPSGLDRALWW